MLNEQEACFVVRDGNGQQLAYVYFEEEPGRRLAAKLLINSSADVAARDCGIVPVIALCEGKPLAIALWRF